MTAPIYLTANKWQRAIDKLDEPPTPKDMLVTDFLKTLPNCTHLGDELAL